MSASGNSFQPSSNTDIDRVIDQVTQVYQHLTMMLEHNRNVYFDRIARLEALKRRKVELIAENPQDHQQEVIWGMMEQQHQQQQDYNHLLRWLNQQACQDGGSGEPIISPPRPPQGISSGDGTTASDWTFREGHQQPNPITDHSSNSTESSQHPPPPMTPPPQQSSPPRPLASSTPLKASPSSSPHPTTATGYLTFSDETSVTSSGFNHGTFKNSSKSSKTHQNPYRNHGRLPSGPSSPSTTNTGTYSIIPLPPGSPLENVASTTNAVRHSASSITPAPPKNPKACSKSAKEGVTGFQILHCPDCNAKLGVIFEIIHLDSCPT